MKFNHAYIPSIISRAHYDRVRSKWKIGLALTHLVYLIVITSLVLSLAYYDRKIGSLASQGKDLENLKKKEAIYGILKSKGISLSQGLEVTDTVISQSRTLEIPISLILAVMKKESMFNPIAISSANALGLMQIHPVTWKEYAMRLKMNASPYAAFDPVTNVVVATHVIRDLYDCYRRTARSESELWTSVLSAYYAGSASVARTGLEASHRKYVADINKYKSDFDKTFSN